MKEYKPRTKFLTVKITIYRINSLSSYERDITSGHLFYLDKISLLIHYKETIFLTVFMVMTVTTCFWSNFIHHKSKIVGFITEVYNRNVLLPFSQSFLPE
jgi:hypothetical protein